MICQQRQQHSLSPMLSLPKQQQQQQHHHHHHIVYSWQYTHRRYITFVILLWFLLDDYLTVSSNRMYCKNNYNYNDNNNNSNHYHHHSNSQYPIYMIHAWGRTGHEMVGNIASALLSNHALQQIQILLNVTSTNDTTTGSHITSRNSSSRSSSSRSSSRSRRNSATRAVTYSLSSSFVVVSQNPSTCMEYCTPLAIVADWADQVRFHYKWSSPLHYIDVRDDIILPRGCPVKSMSTTTLNGVLTDDTPFNNVTYSSNCYFNYTRDCPNDICAAGAIMNYTTQLYNNGYSSWKMMDRMTHHSDSLQLLQESLKFLVHFVGDIHQPLHCSRTTDRGGNNIHVQYHPNHNPITYPNHSIIPPPTSPTTTVPTPRRLRSSMSMYHSSLNLHAVWDDRIIETILERDFSNSRNAFEVSLLLYIHDIRTNHPSIYHDDWLHCPDATNRQCVTMWGEESFDLAMRYAYANVDGHEIVDGTILEEQYYLTRHPIVRKQLAIAAVRLATNLERIFEQNTF